MSSVCEAMTELKVIEWTPGNWWVVSERPGMGYTPWAGPFRYKLRAEKECEKLTAAGVENQKENDA